MKGYLKASIIPDESNIYLNGNKIKENPYLGLNWKDNLSAQKLLDVIVSILAEEYIQVARENKDMFMDPGYSASRNSGMTNGGVSRPLEDKEGK
ncbi:MAG: hypothetical protein KAU58_01890 [Candidatus Omnitrophica bacterium]|nr:hypothetical protein [Candidatus Omnitrophota bacterium]